MIYFQRNSLLKKLSILFVVTTIVFLSATLIFYFIAFNSLKTEKTNYLECLAANLAQNTEEISSSIMLMGETVSNTSFTHSFLTEKNDSKKISNKQLLNRLISKLIKSSSHINNILLIDNENTVYSFSSFNYSLANKLDQHYSIFSPNAYPDGFTGALYLSDTDTTYYVYFQTIYNNNSNADKIGTCIIICSCESLYNICMNSATSEQALFAILDSNDKIISSNQETDIANQMLSNINDDHQLTIFHQPLSSTGWSILCSVPYSELYSELIQLRYFAVLLIILLLFSFLLLAYHISSGIVFPLAKIVNFLQKDPYYILHHRLEEKGNNEIMILSTNINKMVNKIHELTCTSIHNQAQMYELELTKNQAQLLALRTQINPHFLYNTLNSIQGLAYQEKYKEICTVVNDLSYIMRYNINGNNMTLIKDEILCIKKYLQIIELRFPNRYQFNLNVDSTILDYQIPTFLLQPLVENAISHGLEPSTKNGTLTLTASLRENSILHFECADNGVGIPPQKLEELHQKLKNASSTCYPASQNGSGIGLINVHMRIQLIYGEPYGLSLFSNSEGTSICLDIPTNVPI